MSRPLTVVISHSLGAAEAHRRIEGSFADVVARLPGGPAKAARSWSGDHMTFAALVGGRDVHGHLDVERDHVRLRVQLPGFLGLLSGTIGGKLRQEGRALLRDRRRR